MDFEQALYKRMNNSIWHVKVPKKNRIKKIVQVLHDCSPSKQALVRYNLNVIRNDNVARQLKIYESTRSQTFEEASVTRYNPQVLAPWLFILYPRLENESEKPSMADTWMDLGIASATISYTASSLGLDSGLCRCITYPEHAIEVLGYRPTMMIGVGYKGDADEYWCPLNKRMEPALYVNKKPDMEKYITYV